MADETITMTSDDKTPPWRSQKIWTAALGVVLVVSLALAGVIKDLSATHVVALACALILGRAAEGALATFVK